MVIGGTLRIPDVDMENTTRRHAADMYRCGTICGFLKVSNVLVQANTLTNNMNISDTLTYPDPRPLCFSSCPHCQHHP
jgi:hypothetical protein